MTRAAILMLAVFAVGCGGSGSATFQSAANGSTLSFGVTAADGEFLGMLGLENGAQQITYFSSSAGYLQVTMNSRLNTGATPGLGDQTGFGVGPFVGQYDFSPPGRRTNPVSDTFFIEQWAYTGNGAAPVRIVGRTDRLGRENEKIDTLSFELEQVCNPSDALQSFYTCGGKPLIPKGAVETLNFTTGGVRGMTGCPDDIIKAFIGSGAGGKATYRYPTDVQFTGATERVGCVQTKGVQAVACGTGQKTISTLGCTWKAQALVSPHWDAQRSKHILDIFVGATTDTASCAPVRACNSQFTAVQD